MKDVRPNLKVASRLTQPGLNVLRIDPALTIAEKDITDFLAVFEKVLIEKATG